MEDILQILIFVGAMVIAVVGQSAKSKKKTTVASPQEVLEDMFPEIKMDQETTVVESSPAPKSVLRRNPRPASSVKPHHSSQTYVSPSTTKKENIRLSNRNEARRAFIYSEIFNRKY